MKEAFAHFTVAAKDSNLQIVGTWTPTSVNSQVDMCNDSVSMHMLHRDQPSAVVWSVYTLCPAQLYTNLLYAALSLSIAYLPTSYMLHSPSQLHNYQPPISCILPLNCIITNLL